MKIDEYDFACTDSMNAMLVNTASSWGVTESSMSFTAPTVPWIVSSMVSPVNTRMVVCRSMSLSVFQLCTSLDSGTFSGSQKFAVSRSQTSKSLSSGMLFQLMAEMGSPATRCTGVCGACALMAAVSFVSCTYCDDRTLLCPAEFTRLIASSFLDATSLPPPHTLPGLANPYPFVR